MVGAGWLSFNSALTWTHIWCSEVAVWAFPPDPLQKYHLCRDCAADPSLLESYMPLLWMDFFNLKVSLFGLKKKKNKKINAERFCKMYSYILISHPYLRKLNINPLSQDQGEVYHAFQISKTWFCTWIHQCTICMNILFYYFDIPLFCFYF